jgi:hypothetical protein
MAKRHGQLHKPGDGYYPYTPVQEDFQAFAEYMWGPVDERGDYGTYVDGRAPQVSVRLSSGGTRSFGPNGGGGDPFAGKG